MVLLFKAAIFSEKSSLCWGSKSMIFELALPPYTSWNDRDWPNKITRIMENMIWNYMGLSENSVPHCTQSFCWSLSLWKMAISLGILTQHFQTNPHGDFMEISPYFTRFHHIFRCISGGGWATQNWGQGQGQVLADFGAALGGDIHEISWEMLYNDILHTHIYIYIYSTYIYIFMCMTQ